MGQRWWGQCAVLLKKNATLMRRSKLMTVIQLVTPALIVALASTTTRIFHESTHVQPTYHLEGVPTCDRGRHGDRECDTLLFAPSSSAQVTKVMDRLAKNNHPSLQIGKDLKGFPTVKQMYTYVVENQNRSQAAVAFYGAKWDDITAKTDTSKGLHYQIFANHSIWTVQRDRLLELQIQKAIDTAIISEYSGRDVSLSVSYIPFQNPWDEDSAFISHEDASHFLSGTTLSILMFVSGAVVAQSMSYMLAYERQKKIRTNLLAIGVSDSALLWSWVIHYRILGAVSYLLGLVCGHVAGIAVFAKTNWLLMFFLLIVYNDAMIALGAFAHSFIHQTKTVVNVTIVLMLAGLMFQSLIPGLSILYGMKDYWYSKLLLLALHMYPPFNFGKAFQDVVYKTSSQYVGFTQFQEDTPILSELLGRSPSPAFSFWLLIMNIVVYHVLAWYLLHVIPDENGSSRGFLFFTQDSYWKSTPPSGQMTATSIGRGGTTLHIRRLSKRFRSGKSPLAVDELELEVQQGQTLCLLGQNGAGKTTTIKMLTGVLVPTSGTATVMGYDLVQDSNDLKLITGVCPQFDALWEDLSAREHLTLYCKMKMVPDGDMHEQVTELLLDVGLSKIADKPIKGFSGGMRRRVSFACSMAGDPKVLFLDEPTTGVDPANRRDLWDVVKRMKERCLVILTTHSMSEADTLADMIGIMSKGQLQCYGDPLTLKEQYGNGYNITLTVEELALDEVKDLVSTRLSDVALVKETSNTLVYGLAVEFRALIGPFFEYLERESPPTIKSWGVSHTTLEDVFLNTARTDHR